jgi:hypothetical protein
MGSGQADRVGGCRMAFLSRARVLRRSVVKSGVSVNRLEGEAPLRQAEVVMALSLATDLGTGR